MADLQKKSRMGSMRVAFGGIIAAVDLVLLFLTGLFPMGTLALPALAGVLLLAVRIEVSAPWAAITYGMVAVLSFFLSPDKQAYALFTVFFGYYPVLKYTLERLHHNILPVQEFLVPIDFAEFTRLKIRIQLGDGRAVFRADFVFLVAQRLAQLMEEG